MQGYGGGSSNVYGGRSPGPAKAKPAFLRSYGGKFAKPVQKGVLPGSVADGSEASRRRRRERTTGTEVGRDHWRATKKEQSSREQRVAARARLRAPHGGRGSSDRRSGSSRQGGSRRSGSRSGSQDGCSRGGGSPDGRLPALRSRSRSQQGGRGGQDPREISPRHRVDRHPGNRDRGGGGGGSRGSGARSVPLLHMPEFSDAAPAAPAEEHVALMGGQAYFNGFDAEQCDVQLRGGSLALSAWVFPTEQGTSAGTRDVFYKKEKGRPGGLPRLAGGMAVDKWQVLVQKGQDVGDELLRHVGILPSGGSGGRVSACTPTVLRNPRTHVLRVCFSTKKSGFAIVDSPLELRAGTWSHFLVAVSGPRLVVQVNGETAVNVDMGDDDAAVVNEEPWTFGASSAIVGGDFSSEISGGFVGYMDRVRAWEEFRPSGVQDEHLLTLPEPATDPRVLDEWGEIARLNDAEVLVEKEKVQQRRLEHCEYLKIQLEAQIERREADEKQVLEEDRALALAGIEYDLELERRRKEVEQAKAAGRSEDERKAQEQTMAQAAAVQRAQEELRIAEERKEMRVAELLAAEVVAEEELKNATYARSMVSQRKVLDEQMKIRTERRTEDEIHTKLHDREQEQAIVQRDLRLLEIDKGQRRRTILAQRGLFDDQKKERERLQWLARNAGQFNSQTAMANDVERALNREYLKRAAQMHHAGQPSQRSSRSRDLRPILSPARSPAGGGSQRTGRSYGSTHGY